MSHERVCLSLRSHRPVAETTHSNFTRFLCMLSVLIAQSPFGLEAELTWAAVYVGLLRVTRDSLTHTTRSSAIAERPRDASCQ